MRRGRPPWGGGAKEFPAPEFKFLDSSGPLQSRSLLSPLLKEGKKMGTLSPEEGKHQQWRLPHSLPGACFLLEGSWEKAAFQTHKIRKEFTSAFGLKGCQERIQTPGLLPRVPASRGHKGHPGVAALTLTTSQSEGEEPRCPPTFHSSLRPSPPAPEKELRRRGLDFCSSGSRGKAGKRSRLFQGDVGPGRRETRNGCFPPASSRGSRRSGERGTVRTTQEPPNCRGGFRNPFSGAPPEYLQRLSELAVLEYDTIRQETKGNLKNVRKPAPRAC
ncbi:putative uncharacterized protein C8orf89 homolog [Tachyglossus aculeatus]|uniref:putative uncharacterized protein C8orf89 homolog n=1 Tax=Tachyglossus aculeatus TaxID=9261 RepID=UPI0018F36468|nr:putative uncharacterized protein C8orf89 homolog [Tachyglossus aculeatus]